jgi:hypothetical protein
MEAPSYVVSDSLCRYVSFPLSLFLFFPRPVLLAATLPAASDSSIRERACAQGSPALRWW